MNLNTFKQNKLGILRLYKVVCQDNEDLNAKIKWLTENEYKKYYWTQRFSMAQLWNIGQTKYSPVLEEVSNWMILFRCVKTSEQRVCLNPRAFCWATGRRLFLKPATAVYCEITGPGDPVRETFYFVPKEYTMWLLSNSDK